MLKLLSASLENVVYFKEAAINFTDNCGLVVVSGVNLDSRLSKNQNNGAGKSLAFSILPNIVYESTPLDATRTGRKDILGKGSGASITLQGNDGNTYKITQTQSKYVIERNGEDIQARTLAIQKDWVNKIFPLSEEEFYSYVYLQGQRQLDFQVGSPRSRMSYITSVWRLEQYDAMRKYFEKKLSDVKTAQVEFDVLAQQLTGINKSLERIGWNNKKQKELAAVEEQIDTLNEHVKELQQKHARLEAQKANADFYYAAKAELKGIVVKYTKAQLKEQSALLREYARYEDSLSAYKKRVATLTANIEAVGEVDGDVKGLEKKANKMSDRLDFLYDELQELADIRRQHKSLVGKLESLEKHDDDRLVEYKKLAKKAKKTVAEYIDAELGMVAAALSLEGLLHDCDNGECPTCKQDVDIAAVKKAVKSAKSKRDELKSVKQAYQFEVESKELRQKIEELDFDADEYADKRAKYEELETQLADVVAAYKKAKRLRTMHEELEVLRKERPQKPEANPELTEQQIEKEFDKITRKENLEERLAEFDAPPPKDGALDTNLAALEKKLNRATKEQNAVMAKVVDLGAKKREHSLLCKQAEEIDEKLEGIKPLIERRDMYKTLANAYSNKGLKLHAVNHILYQLEQNLNRFSTLIFAEPFKFSVFAKEDGIHLMVDRGNGKISDVRKLSGAETNCFRLLYMLSSLVMVDADRRTNFVILDEPDSQMDDITKGIFIERFLPFLRTIVPHVFVITPKSKHAYSNCDYMTVVKRGGVSRIVSGQFDPKERKKEA